MKPLSAWGFYLNNKKKVVPVTVSIAAAIFLLYFMYIVGDSVISTLNASYLDVLKNFTIIRSVKESGFDSSTISKIEADNNAEKVVNIKIDYSNISVLGGDSSEFVISMDNTELKELFIKMNLKLTEGRMPENSSEIIMHKCIAANKGYKLNQEIGDYIDDKEKLTGKYKIVGIFEGDSQLSFIPDDERKRGLDTLLIIPKEGKLNELNEFIHKLSGGKMEIQSLVEAKKQIENNMQIVYVASTFIEALLILVLCITIGNTTYLHYYQRKREFGILRAVGYKRSQLLKRTFFEILNINILGTVAGITIAAFIGFILKIVYLDTKGITMYIFKLKYILFTAIMPVFILAICLMTAIKLLGNTDKINMIEQ